MKKIITVLMLLLFVLTLTACKNKGENKTDGATENTTEATAPNVEATLTPPEKEQEIIENFKPAGEIYGQSATEGENINPEYSFDYDEYGRINLVYYLYNNDNYVHTYDYYDEAQTLLIYTFCNDVLAAEKEFSYDQLKDINGTQIVDGYYVTNPVI